MRNVVGAYRLPYYPEEAQGVCFPETLGLRQFGY